MSTDDAADLRPAVSATEVRILEGPNLYFPRPAVKVTLSVPGYLAADKDTIRAVCRVVGLPRSQPGAPGSGQRQRLVARIAERCVRALAASVGTTRLGIRVRTGSDPDTVVVALVWRHRGRAQALGDALAPVLADVLTGAPLEEAAARHTEAIESAPRGAPPRIVTPRVPVASVTGTNGKTTTTRLLAHIGMTAGRRTAWSSTDGVVVHGEMTEPGDYSGPAGARGVLDTPGLELGILETARGGMLLKGLGVAHNDVSVVTNVSADHLGSHGVDTVDQLAEVKAIITRATRSRGWVVLNGDDPRVWAMRSGIRARPWVFTQDPNSPAIREALAVGGRAITVLDDAVTVLRPDHAPDRLVRVVDLPMTLSGLSRHNIQNALAGAAGALGLGLPREAVIEGLRTFRPDADLNPGRMNVYSLPVSGGSVTIIVDLAHNEAGLEALLDVARGLVAPGGRVHLGLGTAGDRSDEILQALGEIAGLRADHIVAAHKARYLRGRTMAELEEHLRVGLGRAGIGDIASYDTELGGLQALVEVAAAGDVCAVMCHAERDEVAAWLAAGGATADDARRIRHKVVAARGLHDLEDEIVGVWGMADAGARTAAMASLYAANPGDARLAYEVAGAHDNAGEEAAAVGLYEEALGLGLREPFRHRAQIQLASSLRNLGELDRAGALLEEVVEAHPESAGAAAFLALVLHDAGESTAAVQTALGALLATSGDADVSRYRRSLAAYTEALGR